MDLLGVQGQLEKSYSDYLRDKRNLAQMGQTAQGISDVGQERFAQAFEPQGAGAVVNPADVFRSFQTFQTAVPSLGDVEQLRQQQLQTESGLLGQIAEMAQARQPASTDSLEAVNNLLKSRSQLAEAGFDTGAIDTQLESLGFGRATTDQAVTLTPERKKQLLDERKSLLDQGLDTSTIDEQLRQAGIIQDTGEKEDIVALIDEILSNEGNLKSLTGKLREGSLFGLRGDVATTDAKLRQLEGYLTLENRQKLRGQGTITDKEQETIEKAASTLGTRSQSTSNYIKELQKLREELSEGLGKEPQGNVKADPLGIL